MCWLDWFICLITHQKQTALITEALQNILISEKASSSPSLVFLMILVYKIENQLIWLQEKNMVFLLDLNLKCKLGKVDIFMILNLPIKTCSVSFHLLTSSVIYFMPFFRGFFPLIESWIYSCKFIQKYFIIFVAVANGVLYEGYWFLFVSFISWYITAFLYW